MVVLQESLFLFLFSPDAQSSTDSSWVLTFFYFYFYFFFTKNKILEGRTAREKEKHEIERQQGNSKKDILDKN